MRNVPLGAPATQDFPRHGLSRWLPWCQARCLLALSGYWVQVKSVGAWTSQPSPKNVFTSGAFDLDQSSIGMLRTCRSHRATVCIIKWKTKKHPEIASSQLFEVTLLGNLHNLESISWIFFDPRNFTAKQPFESWKVWLVQMKSATTRLVCWVVRIQWTDFPSKSMEMHPISSRLLRNAWKWRLLEVLGKRTQLRNNKQPFF